MFSIKVATHEMSNPITIPVKIEIGFSKEKKSETDLVDSFRISTNTFDPSKSSPPNVWNIRLNKRIERYFQDSEPKKAN